VVLATFGVLVAELIPVGLWTWIVTGALLAAALAGSSLVEERWKGGVAPRTVLDVVGGAILLCISLFYYLVFRHSAMDRSAGSLVLVAVLFVVTLVVGGMIQVPKLRRAALEGSGRYVPFGVLAVLLVIMVSAFTAATVVAARHQLVTLSGASNGSLSFEEVARFYIWHFTNAVPVLDVNETLRWKAPLDYSSARVGTLVLLFKVAVIVPLIGAFVYYWRRWIEA
jgi:hypothetical protein